MKDEAFLQQLRAAFAMETEERLASMAENFSALEKIGDTASQQPLIEVVYRDAHSLKGAARAVDFQEIEAVCQSLESLLIKVKNAECGLTPSLFDLAYTAIDFISGVMEGTGDIREGLYLDLVDELEAFAEKSTDEERPPSGIDSFPAESDIPGFTSALPAGRDMDFPENGVPDLFADEDAKEDTEEECLVSREKTAYARDEKTDTLPPEIARPVITHADPQEISDTRIKSAGSVRVATEKLDRLLLQAEEMVMLKMIAGEDSAELTHVLESLKPALLQARQIDSDLRSVRKYMQQEEQAGHDDEYLKCMGRVLGYVTANEALVASLQRQFREMIRIQTQNFYQITRQVDEFLENVKTIAMLPFSTLCTLFPRMVRDIAREQGKEVNLVLTGGDIEVDRRILEELKDVLLHLLRNAVDHGLERPDVRRRAGKNPTGELAVHVCRREGNRIEVQVVDDGQGIRLDSLRTRAVQNGLVSAEEIESLSDADVTDFIFRSGMSTSPIITEISGRGLGMSIVQEKIEFLGGTHSIKTTPGQGCSFVMQVPVTLSTFKGFQVRVGDQTFILPTTHMEQAVRIDSRKIRMMEHRETIVWGGKTISLADLGQVLGVIREKDTGYVPVVVLRAGDRLMGFKVDALLGEHEVLVKSLGPQLKRVQNVSAATIRRSGEVALILNVHDLIESGAGSVLSPDRVMPAAADERQRTILVVEDSITSRMLLKNVLEGAGYRVLTAVDGRAGFTSLHGESIDLVVSDVEMPRMNGFEMTKKIREDPGFSDLPVVLVTSLSSSQDRERGIDVGASAYILKSDFDQSDLLHTIKRLIL